MEGHPTGGSDYCQDPAGREAAAVAEAKHTPTGGRVLIPAIVCSYTHAILPFISGSARKYQVLWPIKKL